MTINDAAIRRVAARTKPSASFKGVKPLKGKYIGKEKYQGLTKNAPKGKYKGKYIGPDKYKGDVAAWEADKKRNTRAPGNLEKMPTLLNRPTPLKGGKGVKPPGAVAPGPGSITPLVPEKDMYKQS